MRRRHLAATAALPLVLLLAGCGSSGSTDAGGHPSGTHTMADGSTMDDSQMQGMQSTDAKPSSTAAMVCGTEIATAVERTFGLAERPVGLHAFSDRLFRCTYQLGGGDLRLSVKDLTTAGPGRAYFDGLRARLPATRPVRGLENFGFPAFESAHGDVVFLKDHKTLWVDASRLTPADLPAGFSREDAAYAVAAAVIACWTE